MGSDPDIGLCSVPRQGLFSDKMDSFYHGSGPCQLSVSLPSTKSSVSRPQ
jgi:hypothetical protein